MARWQMEEWAHNGSHWPQVSRNGLTMESVGRRFPGMSSQWRNGGMANILWLTMEEWMNGKYFDLLFNA